jgi:hypothetical protein
VDRSVRKVHLTWLMLEDDFVKIFRLGESSYGFWSREESVRGEVGSSWVASSSGKFLWLFQERNEVVLRSII